MRAKDVSSSHDSPTMRANKHLFQFEVVQEWLLSLSLFDPLVMKFSVKQVIASPYMHEGLMRLILRLRVDFVGVIVLRVGMSDYKQLRPL